MKYTENLQLKKPEPDEFYNVNDFNDNADAVDSAMLKNTNDIDGIKNTTIPKLTGDIKTINDTTIPKINQDVSDIKNTMIPAIKDDIVKISDITIPKVYTDINDAITPKVYNVTVQATNWTASGELWRFKTTVKATDGDGLEIQDIPPATVLKLSDDGIQLMAENDTGAVSIIALGAKPAIAVKMSVKVQKERVQ